MEMELKKLNIYLDLVDVFNCAFILLDDIDKINELKDALKNKVTFVSSCNTIDKLIDVKNRVMNGEKIILYNLDELYEQFAEYDIHHNGVFHFYQRFTESYRDKLWENNKGHLYFVLTNEQLNDYYERFNHFQTMRTDTLDFTKDKVKMK